MCSLTILPKKAIDNLSSHMPPFRKPLRKSEYVPLVSFQRADTGGNAAGNMEPNGLLRAIRNRKGVWAPEVDLR